jgi:hypothetical protein
MEKDGFVERLIFCDEATFHISGKVNRHNIRIWGTEQPHAQIEYLHDSPKVNVFCAVSREKLHGPFFFTEAGGSFLDMFKTDCYPNYIPIMTIIFNSLTEFQPPPLPIFTRMY